jgi:hypothetical protein
MLTLAGRVARDGDGGVLLLGWFQVGWVRIGECKAGKRVEDLSVKVLLTHCEHVFGAIIVCCRGACAS